MEISCRNSNPLNNDRLEYTEDFRNIDDDGLSCARIHGDDSSSHTSSDIITLHLVFLLSRTNPPKQDLKDIRIADLLYI